MTIGRYQRTNHRPIIGASLLSSGCTPRLNVWSVQQCLGPRPSAMTFWTAFAPSSASFTASWSVCVPCTQCVDSLQSSLPSISLYHCHPTRNVLCPCADAIQRPSRSSFAPSIHPCGLPWVSAHAASHSAGWTFHLSSVWSGSAGQHLVHYQLTTRRTSASGTRTTKWGLHPGGDARTYQWWQSRQSSGS